MLLQEAICLMGNSKQLWFLMNAEMKHSFSLVPIVIIGTVMCICLDTLNQIPFLWTAKDVLDVHYYWFNSFVFGGFYSVYVVPVLAAIPYALSYCNEYQFGVCNQKLSRVSTKIYCISKVMNSILIGGFSVAAGGITFICFANYFVPLINSDRLLENIGMPYFDLLQQGNGILFFVATVFLLFLTGSLWSLIALVTSAYVPNKYVVISAPLIFSFFFTRLNIILKIPDTHRLDLWLRGRSIIENDSTTLITSGIMVTLLSVLLGIIFYKKVKRRMQNE